jgi:autoinducer 2-degrading protein
MFIVHVFVEVKPECIEAFKAASVENASSSLKEPGIARFDFVEELDNPAKFLLVEVYRTPEDAAKHKETAHYLMWRDRVADMMATPRTAVKFRNVFPGETGFDVGGRA